MLALSVVALADGGITQGPGFTAPPPPEGGITQGPGFDSENPPDNSSIEAIDWATLVDWLAQSIVS